MRIPERIAFPQPPQRPMVQLVIDSCSVNPTIWNRLIHRPYVSSLLVSEAFCSVKRAFWCGFTVHITGDAPEVFALILRCNITWDNLWRVEIIWSTWSYILWVLVKFACEAVFILHETYLSFNVFLLTLRHNIWMSYRPKLLCSQVTLIIFPKNQFPALFFILILEKNNSPELWFC